MWWYIRTLSFFSSKKLPFLHILFYLRTIYGFDLTLSSICWSRETSSLFLPNFNLLKLGRSSPFQTVSSRIYKSCCNRSCWFAWSINRDWKLSAFIWQQKLLVMRIFYLSSVYPHWFHGFKLWSTFDCGPCLSKITIVASQLWIHF